MTPRPLASMSAAGVGLECTWWVVAHTVMKAMETTETTNHPVLLIRSFPVCGERADAIPSPEHNQGQIFQKWNAGWRNLLFVARNSLEQQLGSFLRKRRGSLTFAQWSRKIGLPPSTLCRLEVGQQSITLRRLQQIMSRLKCGFDDIFTG